MGQGTAVAPRTVEDLAATLQGVSHWGPSRTLGKHCAGVLDHQVSLRKLPTGRCITGARSEAQEPQRKAPSSCSVSPVPSADKPEAVSSGKGEMLPGSSSSVTKCGREDGLGAGATH